MSPVERAFQLVVFSVAVIAFWYGFVPMGLYYFEWIFNIGGRRR